MNLKQPAVAAMLGVLCAGSAWALPQTPVAPRAAWVARYNGPGNTLDAVSAVAVDQAGNVIVTGYSSGTGTEDFVTAKYDALGNELWTRRYFGSGNRASALAVDREGNVHVTGVSYGGPSTGSDYATLKYAPDGTLLWVARYSGPLDYDAPTALALDAFGNVYVTGESRSFRRLRDIDTDIATVKYDKDGNQIWVRRYGVMEFASDGGRAIAVDNAGNVLVAGFAQDTARGTDYATLKYAADGTLLWVRLYNGPGRSFDQALALAVDAADNVVVTGRSQLTSSPLSDDYATLKYDPAGNQLWVARYNGPANNFDSANAIAVDARGDVVVTGESFKQEIGGGFDYDYATLKYDADGNELWLRRYNGPGNGSDQARAVAIDARGNVFVTGVSPGLGSGGDFATLRYDAGGSLDWVLRYNGPANSGDGASALALDALGNLYVGGTSGGIGTGLDFATIKYTPRARLIKNPTGVN